MAMLNKVTQIVRRLGPLAPWRLLRTLDEVRELPALRTQVKEGLKETKRLKKQVLETQRQLDARAKQTRDEPKELAEFRTRVEQARAIYKSDIRSCILYLTKRDDRQLYGTQMCRLQNEQEFPKHSPFWVPDEDIEVVREVPGRPNSAVVFLNSTGAHRASIPADAPPETDRYIYQVQLGPERAVRDALTARLPADHAQRRVQKDTTFKY